MRWKTIIFKYCHCKSKITVLQKKSGSQLRRFSNFSCWTQRMTFILGRSGTVIVPPYWQRFRSMATPPSIWASWETSKTSRHYFYEYVSLPTNASLCSTALMTFSMLWMKASAVLMSSLPQEAYPWERRYDDDTAGTPAVFYWHAVVKRGTAACSYSDRSHVIIMINKCVSY